MNHRVTMKLSRFTGEFAKPMYAIAIVVSCLLSLGMSGVGSAASANAPKTFSTPEAAADALIAAAENFDVPALEAILGPDGKDIIHTGEPARDQEIAKQFAAQARTKMEVSIDAKTKRRAFISVGSDGWPFPVPIVKSGTTWSFDSKAGLNEIFLRRIGRNESWIRRSTTRIRNDEARRLASQSVRAKDHQHPRQKRRPGVAKP
jgi:DUF2950 family protein